MNVYEKLNDAAYCDDLLVFADKLVGFASSALLEKNRSTLVNYYYERLLEYNLYDYVFGDFREAKKKDYFICSGKNATRKYKVFAGPAKSSPAKTLKSLALFGNEIKSKFSSPVGNRLSGEGLLDIM